MRILKKYILSTENRSKDFKNNQELKSFLQHLFRENLSNSKFSKNTYLETHSKEIYNIAIDVKDIKFVNFAAEYLKELGYESVELFEHKTSKIFYLYILSDGRIITNLFNITKSLNEEVLEVLIDNEIVNSEKDLQKVFPYFQRSKKRKETIHTVVKELANEIELDIQSFVYRKNVNNDLSPLIQVSHHDDSVLHIHSLLLKK